MGPGTVRDRSRTPARATRPEFARREPGLEALAPRSDPLLQLFHRELHRLVLRRLGALALLLGGGVVAGRVLGAVHGSLLKGVRRRDWRRTGSQSRECP